MIVTTTSPALVGGRRTVPLSFDVCDTCGVWDRDDDYHLPWCTVGDRVWVERRAREAEAARLEREAATQRRAEARAARAAAGTRTGRVAMVAPNVEEVER
jgi:hypothetical protein